MESNKVILHLALRYPNAARPKDFCESADDRLLAVGFISVAILSKSSGVEILSHRFCEGSEGSRVELLYGFGEREAWGVWSDGYESALALEFVHASDDLLLCIEYNLLDEFRSGTNIDISINSGEFSSHFFSGDGAKFEMSIDGQQIESAEQSPGGRFSERVAVVVLGMHRSGTSALTRLISLAGATLPKNLMEAMPDNPTGFWESNEIASANDLILRSVGCRWDGIDECRLTEAQRRIFEPGLVELIRKEFNDSNFIVIKDPRVSLLIELWDGVLKAAGYKITYVTALRHPFEVANSLYRRSQMPHDYAVLLWAQYITSILSAGIKNRFIMYEDQIVNPSAVVAGILVDCFEKEVSISEDIVGEMSAFVDGSLNNSKNIDSVSVKNNEIPLHLFESLLEFGEEIEHYRDRLDRTLDWIEERRMFSKTVAYYKIREFCEI